jgi:hypothetical protein
MWEVQVEYRAGTPAGGCADIHTPTGTDLHRYYETRRDHPDPRRHWDMGLRRCENNIIAPPPAI